MYFHLSSFLGVSFHILVINPGKTLIMVISVMYVLKVYDSVLIFTMDNEKSSPLLVANSPLVFTSNPTY